MVLLPDMNMPIGQKTKLFFYPLVIGLELIVKLLGNTE